MRPHVFVVRRRVLDALGDVAVVARREVEAQAELSLLLTLEMVGHATRDAVVEGAVLDR
jgi:hypothetical protein